MKVIIDIPEKAYELLKSKSELDNIAESIIANGVPLPKGHGDLIDRNYFANKYGCCGNEYCEHSDEYEECNSRIISKYGVDSIPATIPADQ